MFSTMVLYSSYQSPHHFNSPPHWYRQIYIYMLTFIISFKFVITLLYSLRQHICIYIYMHNANALHNYAVRTCIRVIF